MVEVDESFFGPARVRGRPGPRKKGRGTLKQPVFGIYEREGAVYTELVTDCSKETLQAIIRGKVSPESIIHSDCRKGYDGLVDLATTNISASTNPDTLRKNRSTLTASKHSGALQNAVWQSLMA